MVEFVSYNGSFPNQCRGELIVRIDGEEVNLGKCLTSGGSVWINEDLMGRTEYGPWRVDDVPEKYLSYVDEIIEIVNENIPWGCCGGCI